VKPSSSEPIPAPLSIESETVPDRGATALRCLVGFLWIVYVVELTLAGDVTAPPWSWLFRAGAASLVMLYAVVHDWGRQEPSRAKAQPNERTLRAPGMSTTTVARPTGACTWRQYHGRSPRHHPRSRP
jgi:hypothetical protein